MRLFYMFIVCFSLLSTGVEARSLEKWKTNPYSTKIEEVVINDSGDVAVKLNNHFTFIWQATESSKSPINWKIGNGVQFKGNFNNGVYILKNRDLSQKIKFADVTCDFEQTLTIAEIGDNNITLSDGSMWDFSRKKCKSEILGVVEGWNVGSHLMPVYPNGSFSGTKAKHYLYPISLDGKKLGKRRKARFIPGPASD